MSGNKETGRVIGGYKAALANPRTSAEAKENAREAIDELQSSPETAVAQDTEKNPGNVIGGHKAALKNPNVSEEAKEHSREVLEEMDAA